MPNTLVTIVAGGNTHTVSPTQTHRMTIRWITSNKGEVDYRDGSTGTLYQNLTEITHEHGTDYNQDQIKFNFDRSANCNHPTNDSYATVTAPGNQNHTSEMILGNPGTPGWSLTVKVKKR